MGDMSEIGGIGIDLVEVQRVRSAVGRWGDRFLSRVFTSHEVEYCLNRGAPYEHLAARFAAKEAVFKAIGRGWGQGAVWTGVEIRSDGRSKPEVILRGAVRDLAAGREVMISLSHTSTYAIAVAAIQRKCEV